VYFASMSVSAVEDLVVQSAELLPTIRGLITSLNEIVGVSQAVKVDIQEATDMHDGILRTPTKTRLSRRCDLSVAYNNSIIIVIGVSFNGGSREFW
jgi:hypothetical protein